jgi:hypothetical protein
MSEQRNRQDTCALAQARRNSSCRRLYRLYEMCEELRIRRPSQYSSMKPRDVVQKKSRLLFSVITNLGLLLTSSVAAFSGFAIQVGYHMGHDGNIDKSLAVLGLTYSGWSTTHKIFIIVLSLLVTVHIIQHWNRYKIMVRKKLYGRKKTAVILTMLFIAVAVTGYIPWVIDLAGGDAVTRKLFIEIHDKITLILFSCLIIHTIQKFRWFITAYEILKR